MDKRRTESTIEAVTTAYGVSYRLPRRGGFRNAPKMFRMIELICAVALIGAVAVGVTIAILNQSWQGMTSFVLPGVFMLGSFAVLTTCNFVQHGWTEDRISMRGIRVIERLGMFRWTKRRGGDVALTELRIETQRLDKDDAAPMIFRTRLVAELDRGKPLCLTRFYFPEVIREFAEILEAAEGASIVERVSSDAKDVPPQNERNLVARDRSARDHAGRAQNSVRPQPVSSNAIVTRSSGELSINFPPQGLVKGSRGLVPFGIVWIAFSTTIIGVMMFAGGGGIGHYAFLSLFLLVFVGIGAGLLVYGISLAKRRAYFDVVGETFVVSRQTLFGGVQQFIWNRAEVESIAAKASSTKVNDVPLYELLKMSLRACDGVQSDTSELSVLWAEPGVDPQDAMDWHRSMDELRVRLARLASRA